MLWKIYLLVSLRRHHLNHQHLLLQRHQQVLQLHLWVYLWCAVHSLSQLCLLRRRLVRVFLQVRGLLFSKTLRALTVLKFEQDDHYVDSVLKLTWNFFPLQFHIVQQLPEIISIVNVENLKVLLDDKEQERYIKLDQQFPIEFRLVTFKNIQNDQDTFLVDLE